MSTAIAYPPSTLTAVDLATRFGAMPVYRIRFDPPPGTATEKDVLAIYQREKRLCELVDGVLVEKTMGLRESYLAVEIVKRLGTFVDQHDLGIVLGADGMARLAPGLVRIPDVSFIPWDQLPGRSIPNIAMLKRMPVLAVEVLSPSNTKQEMDRKLRDYFQAGARLVWYVDPAARTATVYVAPDQFTVLQEDQALDGGDVLPGFALPLSELFARLESQPEGGGEQQGKRRPRGARNEAKNKRK